MTDATASKTESAGAKNARVAVAAGGFALFMLGMAFAAVPLYQIFCQVTGFGGTTQRAEAPSDTVLDKVVSVRFDSNVSGGLGWKFEPVVKTVDVRVGENALAFYRATNISEKPLVGTASFNVAPLSVGAYFAKIECFCFTEQRLEPGQSVEMPVSFFVDPEFAKDKDTKGISQITLSYTFYPVDNPTEDMVTTQDQALVPTPSMQQSDPDLRPRG